VLRRAGYFRRGADFEQRVEERSAEAAPTRRRVCRISGGEAAEFGDVFSRADSDGAGGFLGIFLGEEGEMTGD
jgi:hypothetical protein